MNNTVNKNNTLTTRGETSYNDPRQSTLPETEKPQPRAVSPLVKVSVFVGIFLLRILDGVPWVWGNLNIYVTSFYYAKGDDSSGSSTNWLLTVDGIGFSFGLVLGGLVASKIGIRLTLLIALLGFNTGLIFSYYTVQHSAIALCATFGALTGLSGGMVENCQLTLIVRWTDLYKGLSASSVASMNILGAVVINLVMTMFINPYNERTNAVRDEISIFTQSDVVDRVPYSFLLYGILSSIFNMVGFFLIRINREDDNIVHECIKKCRSFLLYRKGANSETVRLKDESEVTCYDTLRNGECAEGIPHLDSNLHQEQPGMSLEDSTTAVDISRSLVEDEDTRLHLTPKQALRTRAFYVLWIFSTILTYEFFTLNTYYKAFGLRSIPDDHFLTVVVMVKCLATPMAAWTAGFSGDKFGMKPTMLVLSGVLCLVASFYYTTAANKWLYLLSTTLYGCALFSLFCVMSACCVKLYGQSHFSTIFGLIQSLAVVGTLVAPALTAWILSTHGWMVLLSTMGGLALCQVILIAAGLPNAKLYCRKGELEDENVEGNDR